MGDCRLTLWLPQVGVFVDVESGEAAILVPAVHTFQEKAVVAARWLIEARSEIYPL